MGYMRDLAMESLNEILDDLEEDEFFEDMTREELAELIEELEEDYED